MCVENGLGGVRRKSPAQKNGRQSYRLERGYRVGYHGAEAPERYPTLPELAKGGREVHNVCDD